MDALLARTRRFLQEEAPEIFPPAEPTRKLDDRETARLDQLASAPRPRETKAAAPGSPGPVNSGAEGL